MPADPRLVGVVLAGGLGRRLGGAKASVELFGRPLAAWVAQALGEVADEVVIAAKQDALVPALDGVSVWREPATPVHPLAGVAWALARAGEQGEDVLVCAVDLPFCAGAVRAVAAAAAADVTVPVVVADGQPLLGIYRAPVADVLRAAVQAGRPARAVVAELGAVAVPVPDPDRALFNVNTPEDLARAEALLAGG